MISHLTGVSNFNILYQNLNNSDIPYEGYLYQPLFLLPISYSSYPQDTINKSGSGSLPYLNTASYIHEHCQNANMREYEPTKDSPLGKLHSSSEKLLV